MKFSVGQVLGLKFHETEFLISVCGTNIGTNNKRVSTGKFDLRHVIDADSLGQVTHFIRVIIFSNRRL